MSHCSTYRRIVSGEADGLGAGLARGALGVLSVPYRVGSSVVEIVRSGQGGEHVDVPVVSVGNITCGGTGKTPTVALIVRQLLAKGARPVILSRGYRAEADGRNDEARLLAREFPDVLHLQDKDRASLARYASAAQLGDVIVLDDGFQYQRLHRDLNVCCIDATNPFGFGSVLPRGLLREPLAGLYRARPVLITRAEQVAAARLAEIRAELTRWNEHVKVVVSEMRATRLTAADGSEAGSPSGLGGQRVLVASGVGNPAAVVRTVRLLGARVVGHDERGDHHPWSPADVAELARAATAQSAEFVVTTSKDAVKLARLAWPAGAPPLRALEIEVALTEGADLWDTLIDEVLQKR